MGSEMILLLEKATPGRFTEYKEEFMEQASSRPTVKKMLEAVFDLTERRRSVEAQ